MQEPHVQPQSPRPRLACRYLSFFFFFGSWGGGCSKRDFKPEFFLGHFFLRFFFSNKGLFLLVFWGVKDLFLVIGLIMFCLGPFVGLQTFLFILSVP